MLLHFVLGKNETLNNINTRTKRVKITIAIGNNLSDELIFWSISFYQFVVPFLCLDTQKSVDRFSLGNFYQHKIL